MTYLNSDGTACPLKLSQTIKTLAKGIDDSIHYCFEELANEKRLIALETYEQLMNLANTLEKESDEFFN